MTKLKIDIYEGTQFPCTDHGAGLKQSKIASDALRGSYRPDTAGILCRGSPKNSFIGKFGLFSTNITMNNDIMTPHIHPPPGLGVGGGLDPVGRHLGPKLCLETYIQLQSYM